VLVKQVLCHLVFDSIHLGEVGDVVSQLLNGLHLLIQVMSLQEVTQLQRENTGQTRERIQTIVDSDTQEPGGNGLREDEILQFII
jgi:hypothetical protein